MQTYESLLQWDFHLQAYFWCLKRLPFHSKTKLEYFLLLKNFLMFSRAFMHFASLVFVIYYKIIKFKHFCTKPSFWGNVFCFRSNFKNQIWSRMFVCVFLMEVRKPSVRNCFFHFTSVLLLFHAPVKDILLYLFYLWIFVQHILYVY